MTKTVKFDGRPVWAEVSLGALTGNLRAIRRHVNPAGARAARRKILAVIKSNAYGHGIVPVARALSRARGDWLARGERALPRARGAWLGVPCATEGADRGGGVTREPVLILTGFWAGEE